MMEPSRWQRCNHRLRALHTESLALITQACETYLVMTNHPEVISAELKTMLCEPAQTPAEIHQQMKKLRQFIAASHSEAIPHTISSWVGAATRYLLLSKGVHTNSSISQVEEDILAGDTPVKPISAEGHHAMINGLRTGIATAIGGLVLAVDRLDIRGGMYGDGCSGHFAGDEDTESTEDGARFSGRRNYRTAHRGALLYVYYPFHPAKYAVALH